MIRLPALWLILANCVAWPLIQVGLGYLAPRLGDRWLQHESWLYRTRGWERGGALYERLLRVRRWKSRMPSGGPVFGSFSLSRVTSGDGGYLRRWVRESCRAELTHWASMLPVVLFFLWNPPLAWAMNIVYALAANLPCIVIQRYNRPRLLRIISKLERAIGKDLISLQDL